MSIKDHVSNSNKVKRAGIASTFSGNLCQYRRTNKATKNTSKIQDLQSEIDLLTSYASDTIYRLHYATMRYDYISPSVTKLLGFSTDEMKRVNFRNLIIDTKIITDGMKSLESFDDLEKKRKKGDVNKWQADYLIRTKDGRKIWVSDVSHPWFDKNGTIIGSIGSLRDVTERVEAENRVNEELARVASVDALTGVSNRPDFFAQLNRELKRINRSKEEISMLLVDIDYLKRINDAHGYDAGDKILVGVTEVIKESLRETDIPARLGGGEFGVILPETSSQGAFWVAERIRTSVMKSSFSNGKTMVGCSVSVGVATASPEEEKTPSELYKIADIRLYIAKNTGRNQVSVDEIMHTH